MAYYALYRRFRPTTFDKVIGQDVIVKTLTNQIMTDKIGHAYLFCGARGTGKTSIAKIFARAVNCLSPINGSPCGKCKACTALEDPANLDVIEIDAASNNGVENIREIRDNIQYAPIDVRFKVYIVDEVHMLSPGAFNALLKTLEEPPKHAIFLLATTEPHKLPATILSRCMRFDFRLIPTKQLAKLVGEIYDEIGKKYTVEAVNAIAKSGEGSVRDTLSVADLCVSVGDGELSYNDVLSVIGATDSDNLNNIARSVFLGDVGAILNTTDSLMALGKSINVLSKDIADYFRNLLIIKTCKNANNILVLPEEKFNEMAQTASLAEGHKILRALEILSEVENLLRFSSQPRTVFEAALIRAALPECDQNVDALTIRIKELEDKIRALEIGKPIVKLLSDNSIINQQVENQTKFAEVDKKAKVEPQQVVKEENFNKTEDESATKTNTSETLNKNADAVSKTAVSADGKRIWGTVVRKLRNMPAYTILWVACQEMSAKLEGNNLIICTDSEMEKKLLLKEENLKVIKEIVKAFGNYNILVEGKALEQDISGVVEKYFEDTITIE